MKYCSDFLRAVQIFNKGLLLAYSKYRRLTLEEPETIQLLMAVVQRILLTPKLSLAPLLGGHLTLHGTFHNTKQGE